MAWQMHWRRAPRPPWADAWTAALADARDNRYRAITKDLRKMRRARRRPFWAVPGAIATAR
jgi:hypothetical protein